MAERIDEAFDYRGFVTVSRRDGTQLVGFIYDRSPTHVEMFDEACVERLRVPVSEIASIELTGEDSAAKATKIWERRKDSLESPNTSAWGEWESEDRPVLILVALPTELRAVAGALGARVHGAVARGKLGELPAVAVAIGMGGGAAHVIAAERPRLVISCGLSGGLDPALAAGDLVLASSVHDEAGESIAVGEPLLRAVRDALASEGPPATVGEIVCATEVAATRGEKQALARPGRLAVDLESGAAARAAQQAGIPWLALRVVLDPVDAELPAFTREARRNYVVPALLHALRGPRAIGELSTLARRARTANHALEHALRRIAPAIQQAVGRPHAEPAS
ncbi:MAG TPA: hypothetical protein VFP84_18750 [Kofleriaceae bacterium]|nr:hypothetical protein [Kofleriaceae bacterium]